MSYTKPRLHLNRIHRERARATRAAPLRRDAGTFGVEFHVAGCDCPACAPEPRLTASHVAAIGGAGFAVGVVLALMLSFAGHPTETTLALLAALGIML